MQSNFELFQNYLKDLSKILENLPIEPLEEILALLKKARLEGRTIFVFGNGGSASTASHMVCDLAKNTRQSELPGVRVIGLNDNIPTMTAYANDEGYDRIFSEPLRALVRKGDLVIALSGSGNSPNVLEGLRTAREAGALTIGLTGFEGGNLIDLVDICLVVPSNSMERIEDLHLIINHMLTVGLREMEVEA
jgi:D-sedoheptulose 7-phosphate isomerase